MATYFVTKAKKAVPQIPDTLRGREAKAVVMMF